MLELSVKLYENQMVLRNTISNISLQFYDAINNTCKQVQQQNMQIVHIN